MIRSGRYVPVGSAALAHAAQLGCAFLRLFWVTRVAPVLLTWRSMKLRRWGLGLGLGLACVLGIAACESSEDDNGGGAGEAGQAGHDAAGAPANELGGAAGTAAGGAADAGQAGLSGEAGAGADGGRAGASGGAGEGGGVGGDGPAPDVSGTDCNGDELTLDADLVRQCVLLTSCAPLGSTSDCIADGLDSTSFHLSSSRLTPFRLDARVAHCIGSLDSCDDVFACTGERYVAEECQNASTRCSGNYAINCAGTGRVLDCEKLTGKQDACQVFGEGAEAHAECVVTNECEVANEAHCVGDALYRCDEPGAGYGIDCGELGLTCAEQVDGFAECVLPREPETCDSPGTSSCDGAIIKVCGDDGIAYERDCSLLGDLVCGEGEGDQPQDTPWFDCVPKGCSTRFEVSDRCDGGELVLDFGQDNPGVRIACTDYDLATCSDHRCIP